MGEGFHFASIRTEWSERVVVIFSVAEILNIPDF